jgi:hypothetical protein
MTVDEYCKDFAARLNTLATLDDKLAATAKALCQVFTVKPDEVAIYAFDTRNESLRFIWPVKLRSAGAVPLSAHQSLVAKTARDKAATMENSFANTPHLSIFEKFKIDISVGEPIQKIMSAPLLAGNEIAGVIQVCRKGENPTAAGVDFTPAGLTLLTRLATIITPHLQL